MELLKSTPRLVDRNTLYFNKYVYKVTLKTQHLNHIYYIDNIDEYREKLLRLSKERNYWGANRYDLSKIDYYLIEKIINFRNRNRPNKDILMRMEYNAMSIYTNNIDLLNEYYDFSPSKASSFKINTVTPGVMQFVKEPKFKYRVYLKSKKMPENFRDEFYKFVTTHPSVNPCTALVENLKKYNPGRSWKYAIPHRGMYLEYDDEGVVFLLHLMFPGLAGKTFKLEKRQ